MTNDREPVPELTTTPVRGGPSPWLVAVVALAVLATVVYVGVTGNSTTPTHIANSANPVASQLVAAAPSPTPEPAPQAMQPAPVTLPGSQLPPYPGASEIVVDATPRPHSYLGMGLDVGGGFTLAVLGSQSPNQFHAAYRVPLPAPTDSASLELVDVSDDQASFTSHGQWALPLGVFHGGVSQDSVIGAYGATVLLTDSRAPDAHADEGAPAVTRNGYTIQVTGERQEDAEILDVNLLIGADPVFPDETYTVAAKAGGRSFAARQMEFLPGHIRGEILIPATLRAGKATLVLSADAGPRLDSSHAVIATHVLRLPNASDYPTGDPALQITVAPEPSRHKFPGILTVGYQLLLLFTFDGDQRALFYDLQINPTFPASSAPPTTAGQTEQHRWVTGDDGLIGWPPGTDGVQ